MKNYEFKDVTKLFNDMHIFTAIEDCKAVTSFTIYMRIKTADAQYNVTKTIDNNEEFVPVLNDLENTIGIIKKINKCIVSRRHIGMDINARCNLILMF